MMRIVENLIIVNDPAERAVGLIKEINNKLTKSTEEQNKIVQVVEDRNKKHVNRNKSSILQNLELEEK